MKAVLFTLLVTLLGALSQEYDCESYVARYGDLAETYGDDCSDPAVEKALWEHWQEYGIDEGRDASPEEEDEDEDEEDEGYWNPKWKPRPKDFYAKGWGIGPRERFYDYGRMDYSPKEYGRMKFDPKEYGRMKFDPKEYGKMKFDPKEYGRMKFDPKDAGKILDRTRKDVKERKDKMSGTKDAKIPKGVDRKDTKTPKGRGKILDEKRAKKGTKNKKLSGKSKKNSKGPRALSEDEEVSEEEQLAMEEHAPEAQETEVMEAEVRKLQAVYDVPMTLDGAGLRGYGGAGLRGYTDTPLGVSGVNVAGIQGLGVPAGVAFNQGRYWRRNQCGIMVEVLPRNNFLIAQTLPATIIPANNIYADGMLLERTSTSTFQVNTVPLRGVPRVAISTSSTSTTFDVQEDEEE